MIYQRFQSYVNFFSQMMMVWFLTVAPALSDELDDDDDDYDPLPGRTEAQIDALIFNFDEVVETIMLYTALFALLVILLCLALSMRLRRGAAYAALGILSMAWFAFFEQHATGLYWIGLSPPVSVLTMIGAPLISAHFLMARRYLKRKGWRAHLRPILLACALLPFVLLGLSLPLADAVPMSLILLAVLALASHLLTLPGFRSGPRRSIYTRRNGMVIAIAAVLTIFVIFGELDEGLDVSFAIRSLFVAFVLLFTFFLVQTVVDILRDRDASQRRSIEIARRETEQARALLDAEKKYARAKEVARMHTQRLATASHDIRQPITSLRATMAAVAKDQSEDVQTQLASAFDYLDQLAQSYMETEEAPNAPEPGDETVSAKVLCDTLERMFRNEAEAKRLDFNTEVEDHPLRVEPLVITRILSNLLSNAIKHTETGAIHINAGLAPDGYRFTVHNTATLPEGDALFELGAKGEASDGSGFGLSIIKDLSEKNGLSLEWQSDPVNGTEFTLAVPA